MKHKSNMTPILLTIKAYVVEVKVELSSNVVT